MVRDEQLQQAAEAYASQICKDCPARILFCEEKNKKCVERREQENVYVDGAKWADEHPVDVWHDASEMPENGAHILMEYKLSDSKEFKSYNIDYKRGANWEVLKRYFRISRWAYISYLLPKGGEK